MSMDEFDDGGGSSLPAFLSDPVGMVRRRWRWMLAAGLVGLAATGALLFMMKPRYEAEASVLVERQQIPEDFVRPTVADDSLQRIDALVGRVLTHETLADLIEKHDLYPALRGKVPMGELVARARLETRIQPAAGFTRTGPDSARIFTVRFEADTPIAAAGVANEVAGLLPAENIRSRTKQAQLTTDFLRRQLEQADEELRAQNAAIREFKETYRGELPSELEANLGKLDRLQEQRQSLALQIAEASNRMAQLSQTPAAPTATPDGRLLELRAQLARELSIKTERHPDVTSLKDEIALVEAEIAANPQAVAANPQAALVAAERGTLLELRAQLNQTEADLRDLDSQVARTPSRSEALSALEEKAEVLRETYVDYLRKVQEAELAQSLETAQHGERVSVLNWAEVPTRPSKNRWKYLAAGLVVSLGMALGIAVVLETLDPVLISASQVEGLADLPVLGSVPRIS